TLRVLGSSAQPATILIRIMVGWVFMSEGIQKFLFPAALGVGRFAKIRYPSTSVLSAFCRRRGNWVRSTVDPRIVQPPCLYSVADRYSGRNRNDEDSHVIQIGVLIHDARGPHRLLHVASLLNS